MMVAALVCAGLAALVHVYIFVLESVTWMSPRSRKVFGTTVDEAQTTRMLAFNQGFYNLFLALMTVIGIVLVASGHRGIGAALVFAGAGSMLAAALVLVASSRQMIRAAVTQGLFPLLAVVALAASLL